MADFFFVCLDRNLTVLSDKAAQDKEKVDEMVAAGMSRAEAAAEFTGDAAFEEWYDSWYQKLNDTAHSNQ